MAKNKWRLPSEIQNYPKARWARVQVRELTGRCRIFRAGEVDWCEVLEWRFVE